LAQLQPGESLAHLIDRADEALIDGRTVTGRSLAMS